MLVLRVKSGEALRVGDVLVRLTGLNVYEYRVEIDGQETYEYYQEPFRVGPAELTGRKTKGDAVSFAIDAPREVEVDVV